MIAGGEKNGWLVLLVERNPTDGAKHLISYWQFLWLQSVLPERGEDAVSDKDAEAVHQGQLQTDVLEMIVSASQQVPGHQLL